MSAQIIANFIAVAAFVGSLAALVLSRTDKSKVARKADKAELLERLACIEREAREGRKEIYTSLKTLEHEVHDLEVKVAERYVRRQDFDALDTLLRSRLDALKGLLERPDPRG